MRDKYTMINIDIANTVVQSILKKPARWESGKGMKKRVEKIYRKPLTRARARLTGPAAEPLSGPTLNLINLLKRGFSIEVNFVWLRNHVWLKMQAFGTGLPLLLSMSVCLCVSWKQVPCSRATRLGDFCLRNRITIFIGSSCPRNVITVIHYQNLFHSLGKSSPTFQRKNPILKFSFCAAISLKKGWGKVYSR